MTTADEGEAAPLVALGWGEPFVASFREHAEPRRRPGRVVAEDRGFYLVATATGDAMASVSGRFRFQAGEDAGWPAVGDWVASTRASRRTCASATGMR